MPRTSPSPAGLRRTPRVYSTTWPRCYVQSPHDGTVFELCRGRDAEAYTLVDHLQPALAPGWQCWIERAIAGFSRIGGMPARRLSPAD